eukprot:CAMPEP_0167763346 /NCGR_PEP_ID=MMETSP0110_2-20121227/13310_1 /TAXON_ID=629695 /ORGANISM="Gymnochlora sp., Strain CCMP2014" /LENGTH=155 /DNA_ID=CAMNT_0007650397 /DNA_START=272 /DNA_END=739 /DNA_ORIENTATION=-
MSKYSSIDGKYSFSYPSEFKRSPKLVQTHKEEVFFRSTTRKKYNLGLTVDPVTISSLDEFGPVEDIANSVIKLEKDKEGVLATEMKEAIAKEIGGRKAYFIDYVSNSTRGNIRYLSSLVVDGQKNLYVFTMQTKIDDYDEVKDEMNAVMESFLIE